MVPILTPRAVTHKALRGFFERPGEIDYQAISQQGGPAAASLLRKILTFLNRLDACIEALSQRPAKDIDARVRAALHIGLIELLWRDTHHHAAVNEAVGLIPASQKHLRGFTNALLRRVTREIQRWQDFGEIPKNQPPTIRWAHPRWLIDLWEEQLGLEQARQLFAVNNQEAPLCLRVNTLCMDFKTLVARLQSLGTQVTPSPFASDALVVHGMPALTSPGIQELWQQGAFYIQNEASQLVAPLMGCDGQSKVLDLFSAPGGKTSHLAQLMDNRGSILAVDHSQARLARVVENLARLRCRNVQTRLAKANDQSLTKDIEVATHILLDPPCSALGTLRKSPELKWLKQPADLERLADEQFRHLESLCRSMRAGSVGIYSVCTFSYQETLGLMQRAAREITGFRAMPLNFTSSDPLAPLGREGCLWFPTGAYGLAPAMDGAFISKFTII